MAIVSEQSIHSSDLHPITRATLNAFRRRRGMLLVLRAIGVGLLVFISLALFLATLDYLFFFDDTVRWFLSAGIFTSRER